MVRIHREPPMEGPPGGAVRYKHFGARLAGSSAHAVFVRWGALTRLGRFYSCTLYQRCFAPVVQRIRTVGLHPTDAGSTPERHTSLPQHAKSERAGDPGAGLARRSSLGAPAARGFRAVGGSPRSIIARCWFDSNILHYF